MSRPVMKPVQLEEKVVSIHARWKTPKYPKCPYCHALCADVETMKIHQTDCPDRIARQAKRNHEETEAD